MRIAISSVCLLASTALMTGCKSADERALKTRTISLADFAAPANGPSHEEHFQVAVGDDHGLEQGNDGSDQSETETGSPGVAIGSGDPSVLEAPPEPEPVELSAGERLVVDSFVGEINGRPVFADEFFEPIEDQIVQVRKRTGDLEFAQEVNFIVSEHLQQVVLNELVLAEAEAALSPQEQQGIFAWLEQVREGRIAEEGGSRIELEQRIQEESGQTLDEHLQDFRDEQLVLRLIQEEVRSKAIVSWRDIEREYERRYDEFNPPAEMTIGRVRIRTSNTDGIAQIQSALDSGQSFESIADQFGGDMEWQQVTLGPNGIEDSDFVENLKAYLVGLRPGQTTASFEIGTSTYWLHVTAIEQPPGQSLAEVQRQLGQEVFQRRFQEEQMRYIASLFEEGIYDELEDMASRLLDIAVVRYGRK